MSLARLFRLHRVDDVPWPLRPLFWVYGHGAITSRVRVENLPPAGNYVFCAWHEHALLTFLLPRLSGTRHVWLNHAAWYMKPIHVAGRSSGVERMVLGSTGDRGREAADEVVRNLKEGCSTVMMPDGPYGPPGTMRKGALHMAAQSGVQLVGVTFACSRALRLPTWDRKTWPLPFGRIRVRFGPPRTAHVESFPAVAEALRQDLGTQDLN